jgi:chloramphenicol-sensitive protein RarD
MTDRGDAHDDPRGVAAGLLAYVIWGLLTLFWRQLHRFNAFELIGWRVLSSVVVISVLLSVTGRWMNLRPVLASPRLLLYVAAAAALLTANWTSYVYAVVHDNVLETALGYFVAPLGTMAVGVYVLGERLHAAQRVAIALAVAAVVVLTWSYGRVPWLALIIAVSWTTYGYMKKQVPLGPVESMGAETFVLAVPAAVLVAVIAPHAWSIPQSASGGRLTLVALTGIATIVPLTLFAVAAQRIRLTILGPMQYLVPIANFLFGWLLFDEGMPPSRVAGFALVWVALCILTVDSARRARVGRLCLSPVS